jgi:fused signal recognition particle receptor
MANGMDMHVLLWVAGLIALAALLAFIASRSAKKLPESKPGEDARKPEALEAQRPPTIDLRSPEKAGLLKPTQAAEVTKAEDELQQARASREAKAREEAAAIERAIVAAREKVANATNPPDREVAQAALVKLERDLDAARKKAEYEAQKVSELEKRAQSRADAEARVAAEKAAKEAAEQAVRDARLAEQAAQQKRVDQEKGRTLSEGLAKTRGGFIARLNSLFGTGREIDEEALGELEAILFSADIGVHTATKLLESVRERLKRKELANLSKVKAALREEIERILALDGKGDTHGVLPPLPAGATPPQVIMVVGVNGVGKTTTIGKLAHKLSVEGKRVLLGAGDTFRAAAGEQLDVWADRAQVQIVRGKDGSDPAAVLFDAVAKGKAENFDVVLCDTAGRLHTKSGLMDELKAMKRTLGKANPGAPHEVLLVVDATNGQNAIAQARQFHEALGVTGFVLTKLDGTAKGGVIIGICDELKIPVRYVGVGEKAVDLKAFDPKEFVSALFDD